MTDKEYIASIIASEVYLRFVDAQIEETIEIFNRISFDVLLEIEHSKYNDSSFHKMANKFIAFLTPYIARKITAAFDDASEEVESEFSEEFSDFMKASSIIRKLSSGAYKDFTDDEISDFFEELNSLSEADIRYISETYDKELGELIRIIFEKRKAYYSSLPAAKRLMGIDE